MLEIGTIVENCRKGSGDEIVLKFNMGQVFEVANEWWDWIGDVFSDEGESGDGPISTAGDLGPMTVG